MDFSSTELLEEWDWETGKPAGRAVARGESYRMGIPHEGVHLWIARGVTGAPELLFQQRSQHKTLYPDCLDITVGGHVPFGLKGNKIQKESMEELGISPADSDMTDLGYIRYEEVTPEYTHREFQHVYVMRDDRPIDSYRFNDGEVTGVCPVPVGFIRSLFVNDAAMTVPFYDGSGLRHRTLRMDDFHPLLFALTMRVYMDVVLSAAEELISSGRVTSRMPGI